MPAKNSLINIFASKLPASITKPMCQEYDWRKNEIQRVWADSLMMSGSESKPCKTIRESLERRYFVNFFDNMFDNPLLGDTSFWNIDKITTLHEKGKEKVIDKEIHD